MVITSCSASSWSTKFSATRALCISALLVAWAGTALAADPGTAIGQARKAIDAKQYDAAIQLLAGVIPDATALPPPKHDQALAAIHFFTALAYSAEENELQSRQHLEEFFRFSPQTKSIEASRYDARFVRAFEEVFLSLQHDQQGSFDAVYPGFALFHDREPKVAKLEAWGESPDLLLLGTADEKRAWAALNDSGSRRAFVDTFWSKGGRPQFRKEFLRRVAFADETFAEPRQRGSLTDRGVVFVLLGEPFVIRQKPLTERESRSRIGGPLRDPVAEARVAELQHSGSLADRAKSAQIRDRAMEYVPPTPIEKGTVERWVYNRDQFPKGIPDTEVVFKFITQEGYGDHVLQREFMVSKVLGDAPGMH